MKLEKYKNTFDLSKITGIFDLFINMLLKRKLDVLENTETEFLTSNSVKALIKNINEFKLSHRVVQTGDISHAQNGIDVIYMCKISYIKEYDLGSFTT